MAALGDGLGVSLLPREAELVPSPSVGALSQEGDSTRDSTQNQPGLDPAPFTRACPALSHPHCSRRPQGQRGAEGGGP